MLQTCRKFLRPNRGELHKWKILRPSIVQLFSSGFSHCEGLWQESNLRPRNASVAFVYSLDYIRNTNEPWRIAFTFTNQNPFLSWEYLCGASTSTDVFIDCLHSCPGRNVQVKGTESNRPEVGQFITRRPSEIPLFIQNSSRLKAVLSIHI